MPTKTYIQTSINGEPVDFLCEPRQSLLECLRDEIGLTGTKEGCSNGNCGACTVILDGRNVDSCLVLGVEAANSDVVTIEGLAQDGNLHPLIMYDANEKNSLEKAEKFGAEILKYCVKIGGVLTGEHGVGVEKRELMCEMFNNNDIQQLVKIKKALDSS